MLLALVGIPRSFAAAGELKSGANGTVCGNSRIDLLHFPERSPPRNFGLSVTSDMKKVLLVEDDWKLSAQLCRSIGEEALYVKPVLDIPHLKEALCNGEYFDIIVLDRMMGSTDSKSFLGDIKRAWPRASVMILSAVNTPSERAELINAGADDYVGKPFLTEELMARMKSLLRRSPSGRPEVRRLGDTTLDLTTRRISCGIKFDDLPAKEFILLTILSESPGKVISRPEILEVVWGNINHSENNLVEATITNLRRRLSQLGSSLTIKNQRSAGYWLES